MKNTLTKYQFFFLTLVLSTPVIFHISPIKNYSLYGYTEKYEKPEISLDNWFSGDFQKQCDNYFSQEFGFRPDVVHFNNEWQYRLFKKANTKKVIVGKENYLFSKRYIDTYMGNNFIGEEKVKEKVKILSGLNQDLKDLGKEMIVIIAPGKATFYPEYIPDEYFPKKEINNYEALNEAFKKADFNYIDFNGLFLSMKDTSSYPLYPRTGIHWSEYGLTFMADSLIKYVEKIKEVDLPDLKINKLRIEPGAEGTDMDIEKSMNMIWKLPNDSMAYPQVTYEKEGKDSLKVLVMADSYYWQMFSKNVSKAAFNDGLFIYYNQTFHPAPKDKKNKMEDLDLKKTLEEHEVIILMVTEANLVNFPWKFDKRINELIKEEMSE